MTKYADSQTTLEEHTVDTSTGVAAGFLVRCANSRKTLGLVWPANGVWMFRTAADDRFGDRATKRAAVQQLRDVYTVQTGGRLSEDRAPRLPFAPPTNADILTAWARSAPAKAERLAPRAAPAAPARRVVWDDTAPILDATAAIAASFKRRA